jgi:hypothetical protein
MACAPPPSAAAASPLPFAKQLAHSHPRLAAGAPARPWGVGTKRAGAPMHNLHLANADVEMAAAQPSKAS